MTTSEHTEGNISVPLPLRRAGRPICAKRASGRTNSSLSFCPRQCGASRSSCLLLAAAPPLQACDDGWTVPNPENNPGLVEDCRVLLAIRDDLAGTGFLNWEFGLPIDRWGGIRVSGISQPRAAVGPVWGRPARVDSVGTGSAVPTADVNVLLSRQLMGPIPPELGQLSHLEELSLSGDPTGNDSPRAGPALPPSSVGTRRQSADGSDPRRVGSTVQSPSVASSEQRIDRPNSGRTGPTISVGGDVA